MMLSAAGFDFSARWRLLKIKSAFQPLPSQGKKKRLVHDAEDEANAS
jgi:hypothetical protein